MDCAVYDTYVEKKDGKVMHFDVIVEKSTPHERAIEYGKSYPDPIEKQISSNGYFIQEMEGCP